MALGGNPLGNVSRQYSGATRNIQDPFAFPDVGCIC